MFFIWIYGIGFDYRHKKSLETRRFELVNCNCKEVKVNVTVHLTKMFNKGEK